VISTWVSVLGTSRPASYKRRRPPNQIVCQLLRGGSINQDVPERGTALHLCSRNAYQPNGPRANNVYVPVGSFLKKLPCPVPA